MSDSHFTTPNKFLMIPEYIKFDKKVKATYYRFLQASIIRGSDEVKNIYHGAHYIYIEHFLKNQLVSRYSQDKMGKYLLTSQPAISRDLKELEKEGFIKKIVRPTKIGNINYYQLGTYEGEYGTGTYKETIWLDEHFTKIYDEKKKSEIENRRKEGAIGLMDYYNNWVDYVMMLKKPTEAELDELRVLWNEKKSA